MTYQEIIDQINEMPACYAQMVGRKVVVTYRAKKNDKVFIKDGIVTNMGATTSIACQIAQKFNLVKN